MYSAYLQIANALNTLAKNIPQELNLEVEKGYALVTDFPVWLAVCIAAGVIGVGLQMYATYYGMMGTLDARTATILVGIGGAITFLAGGLCPWAQAKTYIVRFAQIISNFTNWIASKIR